MSEAIGFKSEFLPPYANDAAECRFSGYYWKHWSPGSRVSPNAVRGGADLGGEPIYVGRAHFQGDLLPCKVIPDKDAAYVSYNMKEEFVHQCEVLCESRMHWVDCVNGLVPPGAIPVGNTADGETLYVGRVHHEGSHTVGKIHPSHQTCYIPFDGHEINYKQYEVLVYSAEY